MFVPFGVAGARQAVPDTYRNPVHPGDYPDPSILRVGDRDFWATTTSTDWAPQFPLLHSSDLINWTMAGAVFKQRPVWSKGDFWAPELCEHAGRYYVYYVAHHVNRRLTIAVASADHPAGPYEDHGPMIGQKHGSIDPSHVTDEDGSRYLIWKEDGNAYKRPTPIYIARLSEDGIRFTSEPTEIMRNDAPWEGKVVEGPSIIKRGEWWYLFYSGNACCGRRCDYAVGVARAKNLIGPWEKYHANPILGSNASWRCPGHGSIVDAGDGRTFYLYHAYRASDSIYVGRQALLDEVKWNADGWPHINAGSGPSSEAPVPFARVKHRVAPSFRDDFKGSQLGMGWQWPQNRPPTLDFERRLRGRLVLRAPQDAYPDDVLAGIVARPTTCGDYGAIVSLDVSSLAPGVQAGIAAYGDEERAIGVGFRDGEILVWHRSRRGHRTIARTPVPYRRTLYLRLDARDGHTFSFAWSLNGRSWSPIATAPLQGAHLPPWDRGLRVALTVGGVRGATAHFHSICIEPVEVPGRKVATQPLEKPTIRGTFRRGLHRLDPRPLRSASRTRPL